MLMLLISPFAPTRTDIHTDTPLNLLLFLPLLSPPRTSQVNSHLAVPGRFLCRYIISSLSSFE